MKKTSFVLIPAIALAATWNMALAERVGTEIGRDARARAMVGYLLVRGGVHIVAYAKALEIPAYRAKDAATLRKAVAKADANGVILVDTKNLGDGPYNDLVAQIKTVTSQPVKYVFITHVHQDHSGNIGRFVKAGAEVITHEGLKRNLETGGLDGARGAGADPRGARLGARSSALIDAARGEGRRARPRAS